MDDEIDYNKVLNSRCACNKGLSWIKGNVLMLYPCEHMYHEKCIEKYTKDNKCFFCKTEYNKKLSLLDKDLHYQRFADILSMSYHNDINANTTSNFIDSIFDVASVITNLLHITYPEEGKRLCERIFSLNNITMKVYGLEKLNLVKNKVFISNHVTLIEIPILYYILGTGFLASSAIGNSPFVEKVKQIVPIMTFERGDKNRKFNIVDEMRKFIDEKGSLCLFPEGIMKHPDTITRFRSGAFMINRPVYSVTIKHIDVISDCSSQGFVYNLGGKKNINLEIHISGPYYPPFSDIDIEKIRYNMAKEGGMLLSRVANRDVVDKK